MSMLLMLFGCVGICWLYLKCIRLVLDYIRKWMER